MGETHGENAVAVLRAELESERRRVADLERRLRVCEEERDGSVKELDVLCYAISHDLRAPLRAIDGFSEALAEDYADAVGDDGRQYIGRVRAASARMVAMIDGILELSRLARAPMEPAAIDLTELGRSVAETRARQDPERSIAVTVQEGMIVHGDPRLVRLLVETLVDNAWKFTGKQPEARVEIGVAAGEPNECFVRDNGAGFDMEFAEKLFAPFQRLHAPTDCEGLGIGLARARRIVQRHGGGIRIDAAVGRGATVYFTLGGGAAR